MKIFRCWGWPPWPWRWAAARKPPPSRSAWCCRSPAPMPTSVTRSTRRSIFTSSCMPRTSRRYKVEIIKRDEGPPTGAVAKTVTTELITNDKVQLLTGLRVLAVGDRAGAGDQQGQGADGHRQCRHRLDHQPVALLRAAVVFHVASGLSDGRLCLQQDPLQDRGGRLYRLPARQGFGAGLQDRLREGRRQGRAVDPDGLAGAGAGLHALLPARQGRPSRLPLRLHSLRRACRPA